jgi:Fungal specific transcription factor domain
MKCIRSGHTCLGYQRERVFVHSDTATEAKKEKARHRIKDRVVKRKDAKIEIVRNSISLDYSPYDESFSVQYIESLTESKSTYSLISTSLRQQLLASYVGQYQILSPCAAPDGCTWITAVPSISNPTKALETAAYALSLARLGTVLNARDMLQESLQLYTQGLYHLQKALLDSKLMYSDETLAACVLLTMYEVYRCPNNSREAYSAHHKGCAKLIQLRGPVAHADGLAHSIFQWFRFMGVRNFCFRLHSNVLITLDSRGVGNKINLSLRRRMDDTAVLKVSQGTISADIGFDS